MDCISWSNISHAARHPGEYARPDQIGFHVMTHSHPILDHRRGRPTSSWAEQHGLISVRCTVWADVRASSRRRLVGIKSSLTNNAGTPYGGHPNLAIAVPIQHLAMLSWPLERLGQALGESTPALRHFLCYTGAACDEPRLRILIPERRLLVQARGHEAHEQEGSAGP